MAILLVRDARVHEHDAVVAMYRASGYTGALDSHAGVIVAERDAEIVAAVRLCTAIRDDALPEFLKLRTARYRSKGDDIVPMLPAGSTVLGSPA